MSGDTATIDVDLDCHSLEMLMEMRPWLDCHSASDAPMAMASESPSEYGMAIADSDGSSGQSMQLCSSDDGSGGVEDDDQGVHVTSDESSEEHSSSSRQRLKPGRPRRLDPGSTEWAPGVNAGPWIPQGTLCGEQAQVLITNALLTLRRVPGKMLQQVWKYIDPEACNIGDRWSYALRVAAGLLRLTPGAVRWIASCVKRNGWVPVARAPAVTADPTSRCDRQDPDNDGALKNLVRLAIANAVEGRSGKAFERDIARMSLAQATLGDMMHSRHFAREAEHLAALVVKHMDAVDFTAELDGLGIASDFGLLLDPVTIGSGAYARHDTLLMLCLSMVSKHTGTLCTPMLGAPAMPIGGHSGPALARQSLQCLHDHPASLGMFRLKASLSVIGGDG